MRNWPWDELGIEETTDRTAIKRAYASKLKLLDHERDVDAFQALRDAYEFTMQICAQADAGGQSSAHLEREVGTLVQGLAVPLRRVDVARSDAHLVEVLAQPAASAEAIARRLIPTIVHARDIGRLDTALEHCVELSNFEFNDQVGRALFAQLRHRMLLPPIVDALARRFGWRDFSRLRPWQFEELDELQCWIGAHDFTRLDVPDSLSEHVRFVSGQLRPPLGAWRAFVLGATTVTDSRIPVHALYRFLGPAKAETMLPADALRFVDVVESGHGNWRLSLSAWSGSTLKWVVVGLLLTSFYRWLSDKRLPMWPEMIQDAHILAVVIMFAGALRRSSHFFQNMADDDASLFEWKSWRGLWSECLLYWAIVIPLIVLIRPPNV